MLNKEMKQEENPVLDIVTSSLEDGKAEDVANQLASYQQDQVAFYGNYAEFAQAQDNVENAVIAFKGNTIVMVIASNECTADLDSAVDSALAD